MGWIYSIVPKLARTAGALLLAAGLVAAAPKVRAQTIGTGANLYADIQNQYLLLAVGSGTAVNGSIFLRTVPSNSTNPVTGSPVTLLFGGTVEAANSAAVSTGTVVYVRVDGGKSAGGSDYVFGRQTEGTWLSPPTAVGNHIEARWQTLAQIVNGTIIDPRIEVDLVASFVHDQARFQFTLKNNSLGQTHSVGLAFLQDIVVGKQDEELGGPIRIPNGPYLRKETLLQGEQVPAYYDVFALGTIPANPNIPGGPTLRGVLKPRNAGETEPTRPTRFGYGDLNKLSGIGNFVVNPIFVGRNFDFIWNFQPDPTLNLTSGSIDNAVILYWDPQAIGSGQSVKLVTYVGQSTVDSNFSKLVALSVGGPLALGLTTTKDANGTPIACTVTPSTFTINAYVQNQTDLTGTGIAISPVTVFLDPPRGFTITSGANPATLLSVAPGQESAATWTLMSDPAHAVSGKLTYTVTQSSLIGSSVQRSLEVPVPAVFNLLGTNTTQGLYKMVSFPFTFGNAPPSTILGLNSNQPSPDFDLVRWDPTQGHYNPVNTFVPGFAYWLRSRLTGDKSIMIDCLKYPALDNQVQPNGVTFPREYPRGWNQIGTPYIYNLRFSEVMVINTSTGEVANTVDAADPLHRWIEPAVFFYDTSNANPQNWQYVLEDNLGFEMVPYQGYWIFVRTDNLRFLYPGVDTPGASVTRAALIGAGLGTRRSRASSSDWTLQIKAKGSISTDYTTTIGVNTKATDKLDYYKVGKPPIQENQLSLDIVHDEWATGGRYAKDLRSASPGRKTWQMVLSSSRPKEPVTFSWPDLGVSVPRNVRVTLIDTDTNTRYDMRSTSSVLLTTNTNRTHNVQVVAEPARGNGPAVITGFDVTQSSGRASGAPSSISINYTLSQDAETRIVIRTPGGRVLRTLNGQPVTGAGASSGRAVFDLRDSEGRQISTGLYQAELTAHSTDGQVSRQVRPFLLAR